LVLEALSPRFWRGNAIQKVELNPKLDASLFAKPQIQTASSCHQRAGRV
jgi:hypothetical protein